MMDDVWSYWRFGWGSSVANYGVHHGEAPLEMSDCDPPLTERDRNVHVVPSGEYHIVEAPIEMSDCEPCPDSCCHWDALQKVQAENAKLREALQAMLDRYDTEDGWELPLECHVKARAALAQR